jgi:hypothetical protein
VGKRPFRVLERGGFLEMSMQERVGALQSAFTLQLLSMPTLCRRVVCSIGGTRDVRSAVQQAGDRIIATRRRSGVLAFGSDVDVRQTFSPFEITEFGEHAIYRSLLPNDSSEHSLLYEALAVALQRERPITRRRVRHGFVMRVDASRALDHRLDGLRGAVGPISGLIPDTSVMWLEAFNLGIEYRADRILVVIDPTLWIDQGEDEAANRMAERYVRLRQRERDYACRACIAQGWARVLCANAGTNLVRALGITDGIDATFELAT